MKKLGYHLQVKALASQISVTSKESDRLFILFYLKFIFERLLEAKVEMNLTVYFLFRFDLISYIF